MEICTKKYVIGIDFGGTYFRIGMVAQDRQIHNLVVEKSSILNKDNAQLANLISYIDRYIKEKSIGQLQAICIGFPSAVSKDKKTVFQSPNVSGFDNLNVAKPLEDVIGVPVFVDNDVNNLLLAEVTEMGLESCGTVIGIYFGTGLGNAIYINGSILEGKNGVAGELGHIPVLEKKDRCGCGNSGCIEMYASGKKLEEITKKHFPDTDIKDVFLYHADSEVIDMFIETLSVPIAVEINIFDPDYVIIGGGVINMKGFPKESLERHVIAHTRKPQPAENLKLIYSNGGKDLGVRGSAYNGFKRLKMKV